MDVASILRKNCRMYRDSVAVTFEGRSQTYAQLWERACRLANALAELGLSPGDRVAVLADNQLESVEQAAGIALAGLVRCPMYALNPASTHAYMLDNVGASACIVQHTYAADLAGVRDQVPTLKHLIVTGEQRLVAEPCAGTTGRPKGIVHSVAGSVSYTHLTLPTNREV